MIIKTNVVFEHLENSNKFITVEQGGTRSGKTYNILIWLIRFALYDNLWKKYRIDNKPVIDIIRKTRPSLKATVYKDFIEILEKNNLFNPKNLNKTELIYTFENGAVFNFYSLDEAQKIRGRKRDMVFINEANELSYEEWKQIAFRTKSKIILDYNPSDESHFIYDKILTRDDSELKITTYLDNKNLDVRIVNEIERLKTQDLNAWNIYGLGQRGQKLELIYPNVEYHDNYDNIEFEESIFGLDFGYNNPSALIKISIKDKEFYEEEKIYQSFLTNSQLIELMKNILTTQEKRCLIYADIAEPQRIEELRQAGFNVIEADKTVKMGIDFCKRFKTHCLLKDTNNVKEKKAYSWKKDKNDNILDEPIKFMDHLQDAGRYAKYTHFKNYFGTDIKTMLQKLENEIDND